MEEMAGSEDGERTKFGLQLDFLFIKWKRELLSHSWLFETPWTVAGQAPTSMGFSRKEYWSGLPFPSPRDLPNSETESRSPALQADSLPSEPPGKPILINQTHFAVWWTGLEGMERPSLPFICDRSQSLDWLLYVSHSSVGKESTCNAGDLGWFRGLEDPLEKEMATHSSILAWEIPWTEEAGGQQSIGSQKLDTTQGLNHHMSGYHVQFPNWRCTPPWSPTKLDWHSSGNTA